MPKVLLGLCFCIAASSVESPAQGKVDQRWADLEKNYRPYRTSLRHAELIAGYEALIATLGKDEQPRLRANAASRLSLLQRESQLLAKTPRTAPLGKRLTMLGKAQLPAIEELTLAALAFFHREVTAGEAALARARDKDGALKKDTDRLLARQRGIAVPRGGFHRYRGRFYSLAVRDKARALDAAWETLARVQDMAGPLPFAPATGTTTLHRFESKLGSDGATFLRQRAGTIRSALRPLYGEVRSWITSYASPRLAGQLLARLAELRKARTPALALIRRYDKPQQPEVDAHRRKLHKMFADFLKLRRRDVQPFARVNAAHGEKMRSRIAAAEAALTAIDVWLSRYAKPGLGEARIRPSDGAPVTTRHVLPGRKQSELEDVLWLVLQFRAGRSLDCLARADELLRHRARLTPWEALQVDLIRDEAILARNDDVASSLDATERRFVRVTNAYRRTLGLRPFEIEERCNVASRLHSQEMVDLDYFGHVSPIARNRGPSDRVRLEGYGGGVGENCLRGLVDAQGAFEGWYHSPGHHRNLISSGPHIGVGTAANHGMWTMVAGGSDLTWRNLHTDRTPRRNAELQAIADELAFVPRNGLASTQKRLEQGRLAAHAQLPDVLPQVTGITLAAARNPRHPRHVRFPYLLDFCTRAEVPVAYRPMQIATIAAGIEFLARAPRAEQRSQALDVLRRILDKTFDYDPRGDATTRREAVAKIRAYWEDTAQWRYRKTEPPRQRRLARLPGRSGDGPSRDATSKVLTKSERLRLAKRWGGGSKTEQAIDRALLWLAKFQEADGAWRSRSFAARADLGRHAGIGTAEWEIAMTGLSLLAFVTAGHTTKQGKFRREVEKGAMFLIANIVDYGKFRTTASHYMYSHAIATQALCELYATTADPRIGVGAQEAVDFLMWAQHPGTGGWRYEANQAGDTSVTGWVVLALNAAYKAGLDVAGFRNATRFLDHITQSGYYRAGYTSSHDIRPGLNAVAMVGRLFLGSLPTDPKIVIPSWRLEKRPPTVKGYNLYEWYYGTLAMFQVGGAGWEKWNAALVPALLAHQEKKKRLLVGSWNPDRHWMGRSGRIGCTALAALILTTYYRYDRKPKVRVQPFTGDLEALTEPLFTAYRATNDARQRRIVLAKLADRFGPELVPLLVRRIRKGDDPIGDRRSFAALLDQLAAPQHEGSLLKLLAHADRVIREHAARALASTCTASSAATLVAHLAHRERAIRIWSARALGRIGDERAVVALSKRLPSEKDRGCRDAIQRALQRISRFEAVRTFLVDALGASTGGILEVLDGLDLLVGDGIDKHLLAAKKAEPSIYEKTLQHLRVHRAAAAVPILIELLDSVDLDRRSGAIKLLRAITGRAFGFPPEQDAGKRREAAQRWKLWWENSTTGGKR